MILISTEEEKKICALDVFFFKVDQCPPFYSLWVSYRKDGKKVGGENPKLRIDSATTRFLECAPHTCANRRLPPLLVAHMLMHFRFICYNLFICMYMYIYLDTPSYWMNYKKLRISIPA